ncbi:MAG TPA: DUF4197 domain-containing protein, partial [Azonexus sp.]|nr:DUF4197 domain-containing protein [Azonexus sp.]
GVKEALAKGADYAVSSLGKTNGFMGNPKVKIPLPGYLEKGQSALRMLGMGKQADQLAAKFMPIVKSETHKLQLADQYNKLAGKAASAGLVDAKDILTGGDDSVTQFFKRSSSDQLAVKFMPIVKEQTAKLKLAEQYNKFAGKAASAGLVDKKNADIDSYVTHKAMDGLFLMIAEEEKKLRANPVGAGSDLLKKVFGAL